MNILMRVCSEYIYSLLSVKKSEKKLRRKGLWKPSFKEKRIGYSFKHSPKQHYSPPPPMTLERYKIKKYKNKTRTTWLFPFQSQLLFTQQESEKCHV